MVRFCFARYAVLIFLLHLIPALTLSVVVAAADDGVKPPSQVEMEKREGTSELNRPSHEIDDDFTAELTDTFAKAMEAEAHLDVGHYDPTTERCRLYICNKKKRLEALQRAQSAFMIYRDLDCNIVAERLLYWADVREPGCIAERNKARIQHLRDNYQLQPDPKPLSEGEQSWTRSSWEEAEERFLAVENNLTKSYAKAQRASINMDRGDDCHKRNCDPQRRCQALRASQNAFMTYRFQHCQIVVPRQAQFRRFGGDVAEWRCMVALTRERIEILLDYELAANSVQIRGMTGWSTNSSCVVAYDDPSGAEPH